MSVKPQDRLFETASQLAEIEGNIALDPRYGLRFGSRSLLSLSLLPDELRKWVARQGSNLVLMRGDGFGLATWAAAIRDSHFPEHFLSAGGRLERSPVKFLLVNSFDPGLEFVYPYPPTRQLAEMLLVETLLADARVYDPNLEADTKRRHFPATPLDLYSVLESERFDAIVQAVYNVDYDLRLLCEMRKRAGNAAIFLGGPYLKTADIVAYQRVLPIDGLILGDGRRALLDLVADLVKRREEGGTGSREHPRERAVPIIRAAPRAGASERGRTRETHRYPEIWDLQGYEERNPIPSGADTPSLPYDMVGQRPLSILTSQRCPKACYWCRSPKVVAPRDPLEVVAEVENGYDSCDSLHFDDNEIFFDPSNFEQIARLLIERGLNRKPALVKTTTDQMTTERADLLRKMGVEIVAFGVESFSQHCLDLLSKSISVEGNHRALAIALDYGIKPGINAIWLVPGIDFRTTALLATSIVPYLERGAYLNLVPELMLGDLRKTSRITCLVEAGHVRYVPRFFEGMLAPLDYYELHLSEAMSQYRDRVMNVAGRAVAAHRRMTGCFASIAVQSIYLLRSIVQELPAGEGLDGPKRQRTIERIEATRDATTRAEGIGYIHAFQDSRF